MNSNPDRLPDLPIDVIIDILCRLPAKSLLRFRTVSKQFYSLIDSKDFIDRHLHHQSSRQKLLLCGKRLSLLSVDLNNSVDNAIRLDLPLENWRNRFVVIGSCDGLIALLNYDSDRIALWNVSTKKYHLLPQFLRDADDLMAGQHVYGFGRHADDYRLVRIANYFAVGVTEICMYSLKSNCWRMIDNFLPYSSYFLCGVGVFVNGTFNWIGEFMEIEMRGKGFVVSFDLGSEVFRELSLPDVIERERGRGTNLRVLVLGGCLCLIYGYRNQPMYDIWVMKEYGVKDSWVKMYSFLYDEPTRPPCFPHLMVYYNGGDKVISFEVHGRNVIWCDLEVGEPEIVKINRLPSYIIDVTVYVESLVSPDFSN